MKTLFKKYPVLCISAICALISMIFVLPDAQYADYIDLQVMLQGTELFEVAMGETAVTKPYESASDSCLVKANTSAVGTLCEGRFAIFMTMEPHKPMIRAQGCDRVKKAVFKVKDEDAE